MTIQDLMKVAHASPDGMVIPFDKWREFVMAETPHPMEEPPPEEPPPSDEEEDEDQQELSGKHVTHKKRGHFRR